jgi:hypothetical protein
VDDMAGALAAAIWVQLEIPNNLLALQGDVIVGYSGRVGVTKELALRRKLVGVGG